MKKLSYPPYTLNPKILKLSIKAAELIGRWDGASRPKPKLKLRKENKIKSIQSSLAIEGNTLSIDQISALMDNKRIIGPKKDILEVQNAINAYDHISKLNPQNEKDFLKTHGYLMKNLVSDAGRYRKGQVGILKGSKVSHIAPSHNLVPELMHNLFNWIKVSDESPLIVSCVAHYEIEFIHPFSDGNGRMGRFWQSLILTHAFLLFESVPIEEVIKKNQAKYYEALEKSDKLGDASPFIEFMLECVVAALESLLHPRNFEGATPESRLESARTHFGKKEFSRSDYMKFVGQISTATASRDLKTGVKDKVIKEIGEMRMTKYKFVY